MTCTWQKSSFSFLWGSGYMQRNKNKELPQAGWLLRPSYKEPFREQFIGGNCYGGARAPTKMCVRERLPFVLGTKFSIWNRMSYTFPDSVNASPMVEPVPQQRRHCWACQTSPAGWQGYVIADVPATTHATLPLWAHWCHLTWEAKQGRPSIILDWEASW